MVVRRAVLGDVEGSEDGRAEDPSGPEWIDADAGTPAPAALELRAFLSDPTDVSRARLPLAFALAARRSPSAAARFAACAMRTRRLDDCLGMSETRIARRG